MISKIGVKVNLRIITKNHAADSEIGFLKKSITKPYGRATAMPPAWESNNATIPSRSEKLTKNLTKK